jgi:uncharacterized membrane protein
LAEVTKTKSNDSNIFAALSYVWILSIIFYVIKKDDEYVKFHARQGIVLFGLNILAAILFFLGPISVLISLASFVLMVIGAVKAYSGEKYRIPVVAGLADKINF